MTSQADFDRFVKQQQNIRRLALRDLAAWWPTIEHLPPSEIRAEAMTFAPLLARTYGEVAATAAALYYDDSRAESAARGRYGARLAPPEAARGTRRQVRWATEPLFAGDPAGALGRLSAIVDKHALQDGKNTMILNAERDPARPRWARVPVGKTCAWCVMLASRGAVYRSAASAGLAKDFHTGDDCQVVASWDRGNDLPPSYDEGALYELYDRARSEARSGDPKKIAAAMRRLDGGVHVHDGVAAT